jgi:hypothetical protein
MMDTNDTSMGLRFENISLLIHDGVDSRWQSSGRPTHPCYKVSAQHENRHCASHLHSSGSSYTRRVRNGWLVDACTKTDRTPVC